MFEREIKFIYDFNLNKVNRLGPYFTFEQLFASDIHPAILQYISAEIDYLIFEDRQKLLKNSVFDYSGEKISFHFNQISEEVKKTKRFTQEYVAKLILHASSFTINYLVRPKWTLTQFVFDEESHKSTSEIKQILNYVYYYKYINKILISYINTKKILSMNTQEFEELLDKTDKLGIETYLQGILTNALSSMAEFFNIGEVQKSKVPLSAVEMFLEEKELFKHLKKVNEVFGNDESAKIGLNDLQKILSSIMLEKEEPIPKAEEEPDFAEAKLQLRAGRQKFEMEEIEEEEEQEHEQEHEQEFKSEQKENLSDIGEIVSVQENQLTEETLETDKEITITQPIKLRIRVDEEIRIEPIYEESKEQKEQKILEEDNQETLDEPVEDLIAEEEKVYEEHEELENKEAAAAQFLDELKIAQKEFEEEDDKNFLESIFSRSDISADSKEELPEETGEVSEQLPIAVNRMKEEPDEEEVESKIEDKNSDQPKVDLAEVLEHKEMTKIIEVIFDYDIEDFAKMMDEISNCRNIDDAHLVINETLTTRRINRSSKEAETFRSIISEYFRHK